MRRRVPALRESWNNFRRYRVRINAVTARGPVRIRRTRPRCSNLAVPILKAVKDRGGFRDLGHCEEIARSSGEFAGLVGGSIAQVLTGRCGECACGAAYGDFSIP